MKECLICGKPIEPFMSFGKMPIANGFLMPEDFAKEFFFNLQVGHCPVCSMVQLTELVDPSKLFHENYAYYSSISVRMAKHFDEFAKDVRSSYLHGPDSFVVEIGSNDGILLHNFHDWKVPHLGIEPSANVANAAIEKGIHTVVRFFDEEFAQEVLEEHGAVSAILGANVICHIENLHSVVKGVRVLLKPDGVFIFEEPYLGDILEKTSYDQIYDEHIYYFSVTSLSRLFQTYGMEIVDVSRQPVHGGSMRYTVARQGARVPSRRVAEQQEWELMRQIDKPKTYEKLRQQIEGSRTKLVSLLQSLKEQGKRITGYGATSKSTTVTSYCRIGPELIEFISDTTPGKLGKFSPGAHIPVVPYSRFSQRYPDYALLFAWNHGEEIIDKEKNFLSQGGKFIQYVPEVRVEG
jgi:methylation protein EvaC